MTKYGDVMRLFVIGLALTSCVSNSRVERLETSLIKHEYEITRTRAALVNELCSAKYQDCLMSSEDIVICREQTRSCFNSFRIK